MVSKTLILTAQHWTKTHGPQLVAHIKSDKCCTAQHHTKQSDWRLLACTLNIKHVPSSDNLTACSINKLRYGSTAKKEQTDRISRKDMPPISEYSSTSNCITI
jgi:hypothetical protein